MRIHVCCCRCVRPLSRCCTGDPPQRAGLLPLLLASHGHLSVYFAWSGWQIEERRRLYPWAHPSALSPWTTLKTLLTAYDACVCVCRHRRDPVCIQRSLHGHEDGPPNARFERGVQDSPCEAGKPRGRPSWQQGTGACCCACTARRECQWPGHCSKAGCRGIKTGLPRQADVRSTLPVL